MAVVLAICASVASAGPQTRAQAPPSDLDALMARALQRRDIDKRVLSDYVLDETERFEILGPGNIPFDRAERQFTWYVRDGVHVRSPLKVDGVPISEADRRKYEEDWLRREQERRKQRAEEAAKRQGSGKPPVFNGSPNEPRFVSESYFMDFKFEPGNYYLAGHDTVDGRDVLKVDYYPTKLFDDESKSADKSSKEDAKEQQLENDIERKMNKTALVTLWVDPSTAQIVKYTFENVWLDFLPGKWLVRVDDLHASMEMEQPFPGVWLPRGISIHAAATMAPGSFSGTYSRTFSNYRRADVTTRVRVPKKEARE